VNQEFFKTEAPLLFWVAFIWEVMIEDSKAQREKAASFRKWRHFGDVKTYYIKKIAGQKRKPQPSKQVQKALSQGGSAQYLLAVLR
jgi:hypothetical protein